jgi:hypothetical protein
MRWSHCVLFAAASSSCRVIFTPIRERSEETGPDESMFFMSKIDPLDEAGIGVSDASGALDVAAGAASFCTDWPGDHPAEKYCALASAASASGPKSRRGLMADGEASECRGQVVLTSYYVITPTRRWTMLSYNCRKVLCAWLAAIPAIVAAPTDSASQWDVFGSGSEPCFPQFPQQLHSTSPTSQTCIKMKHTHCTCGQVIYQPTHMPQKLRATKLYHTYSSCW